MRKFVFNYKQAAARNAPQGDGSGGASLRGSGPTKGRKENYLHEHRGQDSLLEYIDDLED